MASKVKMLRKLCLNFALIAATVIPFTSVSAQDSPGEYLASSGTIPDDFLISWSEKMKTSLAQAEHNGGSKEDLNDFWLEQHHSIDALLQSGRYSFGDSISLYLNEIADYILKDHPELKEDIRIYTYRSPAVNAFTLADGIIAVNIGLLAHVKTEAELAFVLSHEIAHYQREHFYERFQLINKEESGGWFSTNSLSPLARAERLVGRSKEQEIDADLTGLELFLETDYSLKGVDSVLTTLNYSYLPYGRSAVEGNPFCLPQACYDIPGVFYRDEISEINKDEDYPDGQHLHPNIGERRGQIEAALVQRKVNSGVLFRLGEDRFNRIQELSRFEAVREKVQIGEYTGALYDIYHLQKTYPNNEFLLLSKVKALYGLASYKAVDRISDVLPSSHLVQGPYEQIVHLCKRMNRSQVVTIALQACLSAQDRFPQHKWLERYSSELAKYLVVYCDEEPTEFLKLNEELPEFTKSEEDFRSARGFFRAQQRHYQDFNRYLISNPQKADWLQKEMASFIPFRDSIKEWRMTPADVREEYYEERRERIEEEGAGLNIKEMLILDPTIVMRNVGEDREERLDALEQEHHYTESLKKWVREVGIDAKLLYMEDFEKTDIESYNLFCQLEEWVHETRAFNYLDLMPVSIDLGDKLENSPRYICRIVGVIDLDGYNTYYFGIFDLKQAKVVYSHAQDVGTNFSMKDLRIETQFDLENISK